MSEPVNLQELNVNDFKSFIDSFDHVFSDCDGVIWTKTPLPGAADFFSLMQKLGKTVNFVSNNSTKSRQNYEDLFKAINIDDGYEKLTIPSVAFVEYLKSKNFQKHVYCVSCSEAIAVLEENGFKCKYGPDVGEDSYSAYVKYLEDDPEIGAVVFDSDYKVNIPKIYKAITYLRRPGVLYINGATDKYVPLKPGLVVLGTGAFTEMVSDHVKREPVQLGKPGKLFGELAMQRSGVTDASRVLFIGDMIEQDVGLGKNTGFKTLLVLTNNTKEAMMTHETIKPDYYADDLGSIVPQLKKLVH